MTPALRDERDVFLYMLSYYLDWCGSFRSSLTDPLSEGEPNIYLLDELSFSLPVSHQTLIDKLLCVLTELGLELGPTQLTYLKTVYQALDGSEDYSGYRHLFPFDDRESQGLNLLLDLSLDPHIPDERGHYLTDRMRFISLRQWVRLLQMGYDLTHPLHKYSAVDRLVASIITEFIQLDDALTAQLTVELLTKAFESSTKLDYRPCVALELALEQHTSGQIHSALMAVKGALDVVYPPTEDIKTQTVNHEAHRILTTIHTCIDSIKRIADLRPGLDWEPALTIALDVGLSMLPPELNAAREYVHHRSLDLILELDESFNWDYLHSLAAVFELTSMSTDKAQAINELSIAALIYFIHHPLSTWLDIIQLGNQLALFELPDSPDTVIAEVLEFVKSPEFDELWSFT